MLKIMRLSLKIAICHFSLFFILTVMLVGMNDSLNDLVIDVMRYTTLILAFPLGLVGMYGPIGLGPSSFLEHFFDIACIVLNSSLWGYLGALIITSKHRSKI